MSTVCPEQVGRGAGVMGCRGGDSAGEAGSTQWNPYLDWGIREDFLEEKKPVLKDD